MAFLDGGEREGEENRICSTLPHLSNHNTVGGRSGLLTALLREDQIFFSGFDRERQILRADQAHPIGSCWAQVCKCYHIIVGAVSNFDFVHSKMQHSFNVSFIERNSNCRYVRQIDFTDPNEPSHDVALVINGEKFYVNKEVCNQKFFTEGLIVRV